MIWCVAMCNTMKTRTRSWKFLVSWAVVAFTLAGCGDESQDALLEGALCTQYDCHCESVRARQIENSGSLVIEYIRALGAGEEKPAIVTILETPEGPGTFTHAAGEVGLDNSLTGDFLISDVESAEVHLEAFTPGAAGTEVRGEFDALVRADAGDAYPLRGLFTALLEVI